MNVNGDRQEEQLRLPNGLRLCLRHEAQATEAAALLRVDAGSDDEPPAWPGLAHLLEHLLFAGSGAYQQQQRLLAWIPAQGGRLNATTRGDRTAFFFAVDPPKLAPGLARLVDMLAAPLFDPAALEQEINVIEAEYRLLMNDADTLCDAAQLSLFEGTPTLARFQVGSRAGFGTDLPSLLRGLREFHQNHYHAGSMTLWLQGPQPLAELRALAGSCGVQLPAARTAAPALTAPGDDMLNTGSGSGSVCPPDPPAALRLTARGDAMLNAAGPPRLRLSFALNGWRDCDAGWFGVLRVLLNDEADGSLMAWLRECEWCDGARLILSWRGQDAAIAAVEFTLTRDEPAVGAQVERGFLSWLQQLSALSDQQLRHYARLAQRRLNSQTPLDQLRDLAFDAPALRCIAPPAWQRWLSRFRPDGVSRLWITGQVRGDPVRSRGFDLRLAPFILPAVTPARPPTLRFYAGNASPRTPPLPWTPPVSPNALPAESVPLRHIAADEAPVLMLYPAPGSDFTEVQGHILQAALRAQGGNLVHIGGELRIERRQDVWLLQLGADERTMPAALEAISARLRVLTQAVIRQGRRARQHELRHEQGQIPVRRLLSQLPRWLRTADGAGAEQGPEQEDGASRRLTEISWQGTLYGGSDGLRQTLSRMLRRFPGAFTAVSFPATADAACSSAAAFPPLAALASGDAPARAFRGQPAAARYTLTQDRGDNAMILFCPPPAADVDTRLAWRLLALIYQPLFFQQLRVEQNIGYVASCGFYNTVWHEGVLFALQSPHLNGEELFQRTLSFLRRMEQRLGEMPADRLAERRSTLWRMLAHRDANRFIRAGQECFALDLALTTPQAQARLAHMDQKRLRGWHRVFTDSATYRAGSLLAITVPPKAP
ncbi:insulinase family protein [Sodalis sp. RH16]|uniref:insulinase family protein n=1 Tax=Sodalis sp. RH16 TaxID=3394331 RepID=UPI0039B6D123